MEKMNGYVRFENEEILEMRKNKENVTVIVENSVGFVKNCIKGIYLSSDYTYEDKLQVGYIGLLNAVKKYKIENGNFYNYAKICIQTELYNVHRGYTRAKRGYDRETNTQTITVCSLDVPVGDENEGTLGATIVDEQANTYREAVNLTDGLEKIYKLLSPAQTYVFNEYFLQEKTMKEIAEAHGVTTTRVGNLTKQVVKKITERYTMDEFMQLIAR